MNKSALAILVCLGLAAGEAAAENSGAYIGTGVGYAHSNAVDKGFTYTSVSKREITALGYKAYGGYSWGVWGVEAGYYNFGSYRIAGMSGVPSEDKYSVSALGISGVGTLSFSDSWALTSKLGIASASATYQCIVACAGLPDQTTRSNVILYGLGAKWNVARHFAWRVDLEGVDHVTSISGPVKHTINASMLSTSVEVRF